MLCTILSYDTTPIHCTPLRLHFPLMNTQARRAQRRLRRPRARGDLQPRAATTTTTTSTTTTTNDNHDDDDNNNDNDHNNEHDKAQRAAPLARQPLPAHRREAIYR